MKTTQKQHSRPRGTALDAALAAAATGLALVLVGAQGCSMTAGEAWGTGDRGRILISADAEGMQAFGDLIQGSITNGKASPDVDTPHYQMRKEQVRVKALKSYSSFSPKAASRPSGAVLLGAEYK